MKIDFAGMMRGVKLGLRKHSPEILVVTGIGGTVTAAVMACRATRKLEPVLVQHRKNAEAARGADGDEQTRKKEMARVYAKTGVELTKLYGPSVAVGVLSATGILAGANILRKRNVALAAAYTAADASFRQYRNRVTDRYGEQAEKELYLGVHQEKLEMTETDENGKKKKVKRSMPVLDDPMPSDYARYFAYGEARGAEPNSDYNLFFLKGQQELANHMLLANGFLFLNDVYDMLGIERSVAGQAVGWVYDKNTQDHGDNYVDFDIQEVYRKKSDEPGDYEKVLLLNFNVDGPILNHAQNKGLMTE